jgi:gluconate 2-dehydrogenase gamma chain
MSENPSRRDLLRGAALALLSGGAAAGAAQHVHQAVAEAKQAGPYRPQLFTAEELETLAVLADLILPGARAAGSAEFIDLLAAHNDELAAIFTGGLAWLDREMERRSGVRFAAAPRAQQTALLDEIAWREKAPAQLAAGVRFFDWARKLVVDAYYTSPEGIAALGYKGNVGMAEFRVPNEALEYALKRSGLA